MTLTSDSLLQVSNSSFVTQDIEWKQYWLFCGCMVSGVALGFQGLPSLQRTRSPQTCGTFANSKLRDSLVLHLDRLLPPFSLCEGDCQFPLMLPDSATQRPQVPFWGELSKQWKGASAPWDCSSVPSRLQQPHSTAAASHIPQVPAYKARNSL